MDKDLIRRLHTQISRATPRASNESLRDALLRAEYDRVISYFYHHPGAPHAVAAQKLCLTPKEFVFIIDHGARMGWAARISPPPPRGIRAALAFAASIISILARACRRVRARLLGAPETALD